MRITSKRIVLTAKCPKEEGINCKYALTRLIGVKIEAIPPKDQNDSELEVDLSVNSRTGGDCHENALNCVFDDNQISSVYCDGVFVKIPANSK